MGSSGSAYEDIDGKLQTISEGGGGSAEEPVWPSAITVSYYSDTPAPSISLGDTFSAPGVSGSVTCTRIEVSDEIVRYDPSGGIARLWEITLEGTKTGAASGSSMTVKTMSKSIGTELNGALERTISGRLVALLNSATPKKKIRVTASGESAACPYAAGDEVDGCIVTSASSARNAQYDDSGNLLAVLYDYSIDAEG
jgi:hypothetical protein